MPVASRYWTWCGTRWTVGCEEREAAVRQQFLTGVAVAVLATVSGWYALPAGEIPVHFGTRGEADSWGTRTELTVVFGVLVGALALLMAGLARWSSTMPWSMVNIPHRDKAFWQLPENNDRGRARLREDMYLTGAWMMWLMAVMQVFVVLSVRRGEITALLGTALVVIPLVMTLWLIVVMMKRARFYHERPEAD